MFEYFLVGFIVMRNRKKIIALPSLVVVTINKITNKIEKILFTCIVETVQLSIDGATLVQNQYNKLKGSKIYLRIEQEYLTIKPCFVQVAKYKKFLFLISMSLSVFNALIIVSDNLGFLEKTGNSFAKTKELVEVIDKKKVPINENWAFKLYRLLFQKVSLPPEVVGQRLSKISETSPIEYVLQRVLRTAGIMGVDQIQQNSPKVGKIATELAVPVIGSTNLALNWKRLSLDVSKDFGVFFSCLHLTTGIVRMYMNGSLFTPLAFPMIVRGITCLVTRPTTSDWVQNKPFHPLWVKNPLFLPLMITLIGIETGSELEVLIEQPETFKLKRLLRAARNKNESLKKLLAECTMYLEEALEDSI